MNKTLTTTMQSNKKGATMNKNASEMRKWLVLCGFMLCVSSISLSQFPTTSYDIYGMDVTTGRIFQISQVPDKGEFDPAWSPNGKFVVHDVVSQSSQDLAVTDVGTGQTVLLAGGEGGNDAAWSPNGQWIAFDNFSQVFVVPAGGGQPLLVASDAVSPHWSPNSKRIVFARPSNLSIWTVDITGTDERSVMPPLGFGGVMRDPAWSPNGQWIAFEWYGYIFKVPVDRLGQAQGDIQLVANDYNYNYDPTWSNNSMTIVFGRNAALWSVPASGGDYTQLTTGLNWGDYDAAYSNNGQYIAFARSLAPLLKSGDAKAALIPAEFELSQNFPNPFNPTTTIRYAVTADANVSLVVFDLLGQKVAQLVEGPTPAGYHVVQFDASRLASGIYIYKLQAGNFVQTKKMVLAR